MTRGPCSSKERVVASPLSDDSREVSSRRLATDDEAFGDVHLDFCKVLNGLRDVLNKYKIWGL